MAAPDPAKEATSAFVKAQFRRYYESTKPILPDRFAKREFGFMFWTPGIVQRHLGFSRPEELRSFLTDRVPAHAYYSSAYYEKPDAPTMEEKGWLGADLIFDLDADHLPGGKSLPYDRMLEAVKLGIIKLWDRFLEGKLGVDQRSMRIVFSGGRGYHIHVFDERFLGLGSHERREIVDFITAKGLEPSWIFKERVFDKAEFQGKVRVKKLVQAPAKSDPGWAGIIAGGIEDFLNDLDGRSREECIDLLSSYPAMDVQRATALYDNLFKLRTSQPHPIRGIDRVREGNIEALTDKNRDSLVSIIVAMEQVPLDDRVAVSPEEIRKRDEMRGRGETDEPVTSDIKRLIRMPSSLHGKTGLQVIPLTRTALDDFRPLRDAVPAAWTDDRVRVNLKNKTSLEIRDEAFNLTPGANDVPQYLAIFLAARGLATVASEA
ncbi:MAG TPA: DNA primase small subunit PriS [Thermoplasmata archaeon]|nr:DNA primase small subunit PriS [Thermoplasmata archaeon]